MTLLSSFKTVVTLTIDIFSSVSFWQLCTSLLDWDIVPSTSTSSSSSLPPLSSTIGLDTASHNLISSSNSSSNPTNISDNHNNLVRQQQQQHQAQTAGGGATESFANEWREKNRNFYWHDTFHLWFQHFFLLSGDSNCFRFFSSPKLLFLVVIYCFSQFRDTSENLVKLWEKLHSCICHDGRKFFRSWSYIIIVCLLLTRRLNHARRKEEEEDM